MVILLAQLSDLTDTSKEYFLHFTLFSALIILCRLII